MIRAPNTTGQVPLVEVVITEELDARAAPRLEAKLDDALELHPVELVVDLSGCPMLDAAAIGVLLEAHRKTQRRGCRLTLRGPSGKLRRNLRLARVDRVMHVDPEEPDGEPAPPGSSPSPGNS